MCTQLSWDVVEISRNTRILLLEIFDSEASKTTYARFREIGRKMTIKKFSSSTRTTQLAVALTISKWN